MSTKIKNGIHEIITDYSECVLKGTGRIDWGKSVSKKITITRDGITKNFELIEYIKKPSEKAHDGKVRLKDKATSEEYVLWSRDLKQGDIAKLF